MFLKSIARAILYHRCMIAEHCSLLNVRYFCDHHYRINEKCLNQYISICKTNKWLPPHNSCSMTYYSSKAAEDRTKESDVSVPGQSKSEQDHQSSRPEDVSPSISEPAVSKPKPISSGDFIPNTTGTAYNTIREIFPTPRETLNMFASKTPERAFEISYKQTVSEISTSKKMVPGEWICTFNFKWPEKNKFEGTANSKGKAAENAAIQALHWLFNNGSIDESGCPVYDRTLLNEMKKSLKKDIHVTISDSSMERIERIWNDYESEIKSIYEETFREAEKKLENNSSAFNRDSTIDDDDFSEEAFINTDDRMDFVTDQLQVNPVFGKLVFPSQSQLKRRERTLQQTFKQYDENVTPLPIDGYVDDIISTLDKSRIVVIMGAAGCGKSTRVPVAVLRRYGVATTAIVSEPRRVAAIGLSQRVADEMGEEVGESIGYQVRLHSKPPQPPGGAILYCTSGVLMRRLQFNPGLHGCSHVFIDEAHERDVNTDISLLLLKRALDLNPDLKIIIMSATLNTSVFANYFNECPIITVPGKTYPVEVSNLEDIRDKFNLELPFSFESCSSGDEKPRINCQEIVEVIKAVDETQQEGAILVFLPGWAEIKQTKMLLDELFEDSALHIVIPVHSTLSTEDQARMFATPSPGIRKIVLATNIAETSITIPDVVHVIDSGAQKENRIKEGTGSASLETVWVSLAGAKQRAGRAGRVQPGHCYRMYTKDKEMSFASHTIPEILRIPLEQTVLDCKSYAPNEKVESFLSQLPEPPSQETIQLAVNDLIDLGIMKVESFLSQLPEPPRQETIQLAVNDLIDLGALTASEQVTRLGTLLSNLTVHPRLARCILNAAIVGCVVPATNVAAHCADNVDLFLNSADRREEIREIKRQFSKTSDHAAVDWIQDEFENILQEKGWEGVDEWCTKYGLRRDRLSYVKSLSKLHLEHLLKTGIVERTTEFDEINRFCDIDELTAAVLLSGSNSLLLTKNYITMKKKLRTVVYLVTSQGERAHIGTESVNHFINKYASDSTQLLTYFGGHHSIDRRALVVHRSSLVSPHTVLLFSFGDIEHDILDDSDGETSELYVTKHNLKIYMPTSQAQLILKAREMLHSTLQYYVERDIKKVKFDDLTLISRFKTRLVKALGRILVEGHKEYLPEDS